MLHDRVEAYVSDNGDAALDNSNSTSIVCNAALNPIVNIPALEIFIRLG
jgi:hypothetical protein